MTSNQAELFAIKRALQTYVEEVGDLEAEVLLYSDSSYSLGVIAGDYKANKNWRIVKQIQEHVKMLKNLRMFWIRSHRSLKQAKDDKTRELILWNSYVDTIAEKSSKQGMGYTHVGRMSVPEFEERFTKVES